MKPTIVLLAAALALAACNQASAPYTRAQFDQADSNNDGYLNAEETRHLNAILAAEGNAAAAQSVKSDLRSHR